MKNFFTNIAQSFLNFFIPAVCLKCQKPIIENGCFCNLCWDEMAFLSTPRCDQCAEPFFENGICLQCQQHIPFYDKTRSLFVYNNAIKPLILALKYNKAEHFGILLGRLMGKMVHHEIRDYDFIVPVPLHWRRFLKRGYNQSVLLGKGMCQTCELPLNLKILYRQSIESSSQAGADIKTRQKNVENAFIVKGKGMEGKNVILVDDVITTGATLNACSKQLKLHGVNKIMVVTLAKSLKM